MKKVDNSKEEQLWERRRYETAKEFMSVVMGRANYDLITAPIMSCSCSGEKINPYSHIAACTLKAADALIEVLKGKDMEVKIQIPDNCELIKDGDTYIVKEKKNDKPRSWEEFCKNYPIQKDESIIDVNSKIASFKGEVFRSPDSDRYICTSKEEAEAFLALMQLRQLRKAWVEDEKEFEKLFCIICRHDMFNKPISVVRWNTSHRLLSFPSEQMANEFLACFHDLCERAKILL